MTPVEFSPKAVDDLERIGDYIARDNPRRALSFVDEVREHCRELAEFPLAARGFPELGEGARITPHGNYVILYRVILDRVRIERILHGASDIMALIANIAAKKS